VLKPHLTFFVELESDALERLFETPGVIDFLVRGSHSVSIGMLDLLPARARVIRALESRGVKVTAWLLLEPEVGYWLTADNAELALARYREVSQWAEREGLTLHRVGLDIEAPKEHVDRLLENPLGSVLERLRFRRKKETVLRAEQIYGELVREIREHGRSAESYQFPLIIDERKAKSALLRRSLGIVNVNVDAEVFMLYQSYFGKAGIRAYFPEVSHIALGVTGGGVNADKPEVEPKLRWPELESDLLAAARYANELYVFSLEGCVQNDMLPQLEALDFDRTPRSPSQKSLDKAQGLRRVIQWVCENEPLLDRLMPPPEDRPPSWIGRLFGRALPEGDRDDVPRERA
jgi:hypothetical protein